MAYITVLGWSGGLVVNTLEAVVRGLFYTTELGAHSNVTYYLIYLLKSI